MRLIQKIAMLILCISMLPAFSQGGPNTIEIRTRFSSYVGKPSWLLTIRDVDTGESYPYMFDIKKGENYWVVPTHGYNYLITISNLRISTYDESWNMYKQYEINDFCHLESRGRIAHGQSVLVTIDGRLSKNSNGYRCRIQKW